MVWFEVEEFKRGWRRVCRTRRLSIAELVAHNWFLFSRREVRIVVNASEMP